jgi:hypothetical protein
VVLWQDRDRQKQSCPYTRPYTQKHTQREREKRDRERGGEMEIYDMLWMCRLTAEKKGLEEERYNSVIAAVGKVNSHLDRIYNELTNGQGSSYCSCCNDKMFMFSEGLVLHTRCTFVLPYYTIIQIIHPG